MWYVYARHAFDIDDPGGVVCAGSEGDDLEAIHTALECSGSFCAAVDEAVLLRGLPDVCIVEVSPATVDDAGPGAPRLLVG
jgi:hypothetical protein